jgi:hypothetical protein
MKKCDGTIDSMLKGSCITSGVIKNDNAEYIKVIQISIPKMGACIVRTGSKVNDPVEIISDEVKDMIENGSVGDTLIITLLEMTEAELNDLPEWEGW